MKQPENDWRMHQYTHLAEDWVSPWTKETVKKGDQLTVVSVIELSPEKRISIAVPNATALFLNMSARAWNEAKEIRKQSGIDSVTKGDTKFINGGKAFDYLEHVIESVIMAFSGLEAFVNEMIPDDYHYEAYWRSQIILERMSKIQIERHLSTSEKLSSVLPDALETESPKGKACWGDFVQLRRIRDRISHMKTADRKSSGPNNPNLWHDLFRISCPYRQALKMVDFFLKETKGQPQWRDACPLQ